MIFSIDEKTLEAPALYSDKGILVTYGDLISQAERMRENLKSRCLIFVICRNEPGAVAGYIGALENDIVPLLLDGDISMEKLGGLMDTYKPSYIWIPEDMAGAFAEYDKVYGECGYVMLSTGNPVCKMNENLGLLLTTSGSTGSPKLVRLSKKNIESNAASIAEYLKIDRKDRPITTLPMAYTYGLSIINSHLLMGACVLMTRESYVQQPFWDFFNEQKATTFGGVPYTYSILRRMHFFDKKWPSLKYITQAGGKLPEKMQAVVNDWARENGLEFIVMYGQTEATARMSYLPWEKAFDKVGSIGIPIPGGEFSLDGISLDEYGRKCGELIYKGENVTLGYAEGPEDLQLGDEREGILHTGDLAAVDSDGYYYITGRMKRFVKLFGLRVSLDMCQQILGEEFPDAEFACLGNDEKLYIYATGQNEADQAPVFLARYLKINLKAFEGRYIERIPKNSSGKTLFSELMTE